MKRCNCGRYMEKQPDKGDGLARYKCYTCKRSVTSVAKSDADNPRTRTQFGLGMKRKTWI